ncbi:MAG: hypothetical protein AAGE01_12290 [Pseudomonadota bacterium]
MMRWLFALALVGPIHSEARLVGEPVQLTEEEHASLLDAPTETLGAAAEARLLEAAMVRDVVVTEAIRTDAGEVIAHVTYADTPVSDSRTYRPRVLCVGRGEPIEWFHCQTEAFEIATVDDNHRLRVSTDISDAQLADILGVVADPTVVQDEIPVADVVMVNRIGQHRIGVHVRCNGQSSSIWLEEVAGGLARAEDYPEARVYSSAQCDSGN